MAKLAGWCSAVFVGLLLGVPIAHADQKQFCSSTQATAASTQGQNGWTTTVSSLSTLQAGACSVTPPTCIAPTLHSSTVGINSFTRLTGQVSVNYFGNGVHDADITSFDSVFGGNWKPNPKAWPGDGALTAAIQLPNNRYVSEKFTVPVGYMAGYTGPYNSLYGNYSNNQSGYSAPVSFSISTCPGDFSDPTQPGSTVVMGCWVNMRTANQFVQWRKDQTCQLKDGQTYYLNYINANIAGFLPNGGGIGSSTRNQYCSGSCSDSVRNGPGSWGGYVPPQ